jgi:hypothetical protein
MWCPQGMPMCGEEGAGRSCYKLSEGHTKSTMDWIVADAHNSSPTVLNPPQMPVES